MPVPTIPCPGCGAAASFFAQRCDLCNAALATVVCPGCAAMIYRGEQRCSHCGVQTERVLRGGAVSLGCPRCDHEALVAVTAGPVELHQCLRCHGVWVDRGSFNALCRDRSGPLPVPAGATPTLAGALVCCPVCTAPLRRGDFGRFSGIFIDSCPSHGLWFDRDELPATLAFVREGGLDRAWAEEKPPQRRPPPPPREPPRPSKETPRPEPADAISLVIALIIALFD